MPPSGPSLGIVDSGVAPALRRRLAAETRVLLGEDGGVGRTAATDDALGHGSEIARIILGLAPAASLVSAQAFTDSRTVDAGVVAEGIAWCLEQGARIVNLSLGLRSDGAALRSACERARASGVLLVAAFPARGDAVYPAAYPEVLAVSGDARCDAGNWSVIAAGRLIGAATSAADGTTHGGASYAAARISALAARFFSARPRADAEDCLAWLESDAAFRGRERRSPMRAA
ncbi:MAG TPA: S8 family serine peptidase [Rhodocyclaceae bacterium]|nr:S8 family serine peptidase [Rhodocyclaceae bacterium]